MKMADVEASKSKDSHEEEERKTIISRVMNMDVKVDKGGTRATVVLPGLSYDDFDRTGKIAVWRIGKIFSQGRRAAVRGSKFIDADKLLKGKTVFLVTGIYDISKELFHINEAEKDKFQAVLKTELFGFGRSSIVLKSDLTNVDNGQPLGSFTFKYVLVNLSTRKSTPLPDWFLEKYKFENKNMNSICWQKPLQVTALPFCKKAEVQMSDTDHNQHTNHAFYTRVSIEAAKEAADGDFFKHFKGHLLHFKLKKLSETFSQESVLGAKLDVYLWESEEQNDTIFLTIKEGDIALFHCTTSFYV